MNVTVPATDEREVEVVASGLPLQHGGPAGDRTSHSAVHSLLTALRAPTPLEQMVLSWRRLAETRRPNTPSWSMGARCHLVVMAIETGGRWSNEALDFVADMAAARSREAQPVLQRSTFLAWRRRWTRMLAVFLQPRLRSVSYLRQNGLGRH